MYVGTPIIAFVNGNSPINRKIMELIDIVKPIVREIVENVNKVQHKKHMILHM